jgi:thioredoxin reductase (NADPH)
MPDFYMCHITQFVVLLYSKEEKGRLAEKILADRLKERAENGNVTIEWDNTLDEVFGDESGITGIRIKNTKSDDTKDIDLAGVFITIGDKPKLNSVYGPLCNNIQ